LVGSATAAEPTMHFDPRLQVRAVCLRVID
jgi:hypothetical protein